jgi:cold shock protein
MTKPLLKGVLKTWKEDRGFGFITPDHGGRDLFVHISAIQQASRRPVPGDIIYYQVVRDKNGKFRAINANIEGMSVTRKNDGTTKPAFRWILAVTVSVLLMVAVAVFWYLRSGGMV